jgi:hypothetical protein
MAEPTMNTQPLQRYATAPADIVNEHSSIPNDQSRATSPSGATSQRD